MSPTSEPADRVMRLAREVLGIDTDLRLREMADLAGLMEWIWEGIPRLQRAYPGEPPPSILFVPERLAQDFWRGAPPHA